MEVLKKKLKVVMVQNLSVEFVLKELIYRVEVVLVQVVKVVMVEIGEKMVNQQYR